LWLDTVLCRERVELLGPEPGRVVRGCQVNRLGSVTARIESIVQLTMQGVSPEQALVAHGPYETRHGVLLASRVRAVRCLVLRGFVAYSFQLHRASSTRLLEPMLRFQTHCFCLLLP